MGSLDSQSSEDEGTSSVPKEEVEKPEKKGKKSRANRGEGLENKKEQGEKRSLSGGWRLVYHLETPVRRMMWLNLTTRAAFTE